MIINNVININKWIALINDKYKDFNCEATLIRVKFSTLDDILMLTVNGLQNSCILT